MAYIETMYITVFNVRVIEFMSHNPLLLCGKKPEAKKITIYVKILYNLADEAAYGLLVNEYTYFLQTG